MGFMFFDEQIPEKKKPMHPDNEILRLTVVNRQLVAACYQALQFRGMMAALLDPLMLDGEKSEIKSSWKRAELAIRLAIEKADEKTAMIEETENENAETTNIHTRKAAQSR